MLLNCGIGEDSWKSRGLQGDQTSQFWRILVLNIHWKDWSWSWNSNTLATWCKKLTHWKRLWCWKDWRQEEKGVTEDETVGWYYRLDGHEFEQALWVGDGQGSLACCSPWGHKELDTTEGLNWIELNHQGCSSIWLVLNPGPFKHVILWTLSQFQLCVLLLASKRDLSFTTFIDTILISLIMQQCQYCYIFHRLGNWPEETSASLFWSNNLGQWFFLSPEDSEQEFAPRSGLLPFMPCLRKEFAQQAGQRGKFIERNDWR